MRPLSRTLTILITTPVVRLPTVPVYRDVRALICAYSNIDEQCTV
jgi:hypothetical protein